MGQSYLEWVKRSIELKSSKAIIRLGTKKESCKYFFALCNYNLK